MTRALAAVVALAVIHGLALAGAAHASAPLATPIVVERVPQVSFDPSAAAWRGVRATEVLAAVQRTVRLNDADANAALDGAPRSLRVRALHDGQRLAVLLEWDDASYDVARDDEPAAFADGAALELPVRFGPGVRLPYVGMGDEEQRVLLYAQRAVPFGSAGKALVAEGFGSSTRTSADGAVMAMRYDEQRRVWRALFVRALTVPGHDLRAGLVPVAFSLWDGAAHERGGNKALSGWRLLALAGVTVDEEYRRELLSGADLAQAGDVARGKQLVESICIACHRFGDKQIAPPGMAPELSSIGVIATPSYLRESIVAPSAVVVPGLHANPSLSWFTKGAHGEKVSKMPPFAGLPPADVDAMVGYLMTLGREEDG